MEDLQQVYPRDECVVEMAGSAVAGGGCALAVLLVVEELHGDSRGCAGI